MPAKKPIDDFGLVMTVEMITFFRDKTISDEIAGKVLRRLLLKSIDTDNEPVKDNDAGLVAVMARTLSVGFEKANKQRIKSILDGRDRKREWADRQRKISNAAASATLDRLLPKSIDVPLPSMCVRGKVSKVSNIYNTPISPQAGSERLPPKISPEAIMDMTPEDMAKAAAERLAAAHPRKGGSVLAARALVGILKKNCADREVAAQLLAGIEARHAAWVDSDEWKREGGRFAPKLSRWLRSGDWTAEPAEKKAAPAERVADGPAVDCSPETV